MDADKGKIDTRAVKSVKIGISLEVEGTHVDVTESLEISTAIGTLDGGRGRGPSVLSTTSSCTPFFTPLCFRTPAGCMSSTEAATAYKTARSHLGTAHSVSVESRVGFLSGIRAPCFNGDIDSPIYESGPLDRSPTTLHAAGEIPTETDVVRPVEPVYVDSLAFEEGSLRQPDDSRETDVCSSPAGDVREEEFQENCCMNLDDDEARRCKSKVTYMEPDCSNESKSTVVVDAPVQEWKFFHGVPWGDGLPHSNHCGSDNDQYDSCLVPSRLYEDGVMAGSLWLNRSGSQAVVPTADTYLDVMTRTSLTTSGERSALDKLNGLLIAFNSRAGRRVWTMDNPSELRFLQDTELPTSPAS